MKQNYIKNYKKLAMLSLIKKFICSNILLGIIAILSLGDAAASETKAPEETVTTVANKPEKLPKRNTPITVAFDGTDSIGSKLSTRVKELMNASNLFTLTEKNQPKLQILISTMSEFPQRPGVGSAYSVVWVFSQSEGTLQHYLCRELGLLTAEEVNQLATKLVEKTDSLAIRYGYLIQN